MRNNNNNSLRILFDLQACQTPDSAHRGVGRYSSALFETVAALAPPREIFGLTSAQLPHRYEPQDFNPARILNAMPLPDWHTARSFAGGEQDTLDGIAIAALTQGINPDVIHVSHVFEGFGSRVGLFDPQQRNMGQIVSATLYDLIPLLFQDHYFQNPQFRHWYYSRISWLRKADLLLAISESSRQDAIRLLGIEPWRIVTVHGGVKAHFSPPTEQSIARNRLLTRFSLREKMVLYTGGDDHRKNIIGVIRAFAMLPSELRANTQLVIVCSMTSERKLFHLAEALKHGLSPDDILITGFVSEQDLIDFYGVCDVFVFPSLYEGLGLPVLEAMACGAPVIGGNNSSVRELIVREDAMFDASSDKSIAERIAQVLRDENFASELRHYGIARAAEFNWKRSAELSLSAFDEAVSRKREAGVQSAISGWLPRQRLAVLTPLPPCRSGIADYNTKFLPYLSRHFEIDLFVESDTVSDEVLTSAFRIFNVKDFEPIATRYDLILYEFGNSEFHAHMLSLLEKYPGIVGMHDAYLGGVFGYLDFHDGHKGSYERHMLAAHGPIARRYFAPIQECIHPVNDAMSNLPCTKHVLDKALGVISHSPFNLQLARFHYPQGWRAAYRTIPQMVVLPTQAIEQERLTIRSELGFQSDDFIIVSFGHINWTKCSDRLLEAYLESNLYNHARTYLIFAGNLSEVDYGNRLVEAIAKAGLGNRIQVTGYLSSEDYTKYMLVADLAVQLRTNSRGGTPKGVLDCLAHGVPVIVNNEASYKDYPDDVVIKLDPEPSINEIAKKLAFIFENKNQLSAYTGKGRQYVLQNHDPVKCAAEYAAVLNEFGMSGKTCKVDNWVERFAPILGGSEDSAADSRLAASWLCGIKFPTWQRRNLYVDVTAVIEQDAGTGIQRAVKETIRGLYLGNFAGIEPVAVELRDGDLFEARDWLYSKGLLTQNEFSQSTAAPVVFSPGDILLMLDSTWLRYSEFHPIFDRARLAKVPVITTIYDLLPIKFPESFVNGGSKWFENWFLDAVRSSDGLLCISRAVADEVAEYVTKNCLEKKELKIGYWHLGSELPDVSLETGLSERVIAAQQTPYLISVGTIEPRKSHALTLAAMENLWQQGVNLSFCIAGKEGWQVGELMERIRNHPELGKRLFFIEKPSDSEIASLYHDAAGLIFMSIGEGFGLPLVEAAHYGIPIVCTDIPVFREIAGEFATYVKHDTAQSVGEALHKWWNLKQQDLLPDTRNMPKLTWLESAKQILTVVIDNKWVWRKQ